MTMAVSTEQAQLTQLVAAEIRAAMGRRQVRQSELARRLGQNDTWLSVRLRGVQPIDLNDLQRIAAALGVSYLELIPKPQGETKTLHEREVSRPHAHPLVPVQRRPADRRPTDRRPAGRPAGPKVAVRTARIA